jgi:hypothetical protein
MITLPVGIGVLLATYLYTRQLKSTSNKMLPLLVNHVDASVLLSEGRPQDETGQRESYST